MSIGANKPGILIHIGEPKTGTTTLQGLLFEHRDELSKQNIIYAKSGRESQKAIGHHKLPRSLWACDTPTDLVTLEPWADLKAEIESCDETHTLILSSEGFSSINLVMHAEMLRDFFDGYSVRFIMAARRPDKWIESIYAQFVKNHPFTLSPFSKFSRKFGLRASVAAMILSDMFGRDAVHVELYGPDIVARMLMAMGVENIAPPSISRSRNRTPDWVVNAAYYALNHIQMPTNQRLELYRHIAEVCEKHGGGTVAGLEKTQERLPQFALSDDEREAFLDMHSETISNFCDRFDIAENEFLGK